MEHAFLLIRPAFCQLVVSIPCLLSHPFLSNIPEKPVTGRPANGEGGERPSWGMAKFSRRWISCLLTTGSQGRWQVVPMAMAREAPRKVMPREEGGMRCPQRSLVTLPA